MNTPKTDTVELRGNGYERLGMLRALDTDVASSRSICGSGALSVDFQSERSRCAVHQCGLWSALLDNDLIGSLASQNGHGGDLLRRSILVRFRFGFQY